MAAGPHYVLGVGVIRCLGGKVWSRQGRAVAARETGAPVAQKSGTSPRGDSHEAACIGDGGANHRLRGLIACTS